jgi:hypothetical protein
MYPMSRMTIVEAEVRDKQFVLNRGTRSEMYSAVYYVDHDLRYLTIDYFPKSEAQLDSSMRLISIGKVYAFYLFPGSKDIYGIDRVEGLRDPIYRKSRGYTIVIGLVIFIVGLVFSLTIIFYKP